MKVNNIVIFLLLTLLLAFGCKAKPDANEDIKLKKKSSKYLFEKMDKYHLDAEWFNAKASIKFTQNNKTVKGTSYIKMRKDSVIWMSVKKLGVEGGRLLITPDSFFMMNRLEKHYLKKPMSYVRDMAGLASTGNNLYDFRNLYDLLLGNVVMKFDGKYDVNMKTPNYVMSQEKEGVLSEYCTSGNNFTLGKMKLLQKEGNKSAICTFEDYKSLTSSQIFSYIRTLNLSSKETGILNLELDFSKIKIDEPTNIYFSIPSHYEEAK
ncbi:MAG: hypothetical protein ACI94Y_000434 [Maribacter sp.]|jgi:hypothetical protein